MSLGATVRRRLGRWEIPAIDFYRSLFIELDDLAETVASLGNVERILEIGCGDGAFANSLCRAYPQSEYLGIDVSGSPGLLFCGDRSRARFRSITSTELLAEQPQQFDLVAVVDVLHHVAEGQREHVLRDAAALTAPAGLVAVKEWERGNGLAHVLAYTADRYVSGDLTVRFMPAHELRQLVSTALSEFELVCKARVPPRRNNLLLALRRQPSS
jgi:2-polyprenyl-3-methyl-5-hydroxy-6-metoxy-1,4-benzoquinol methylase